MRYFANGQTLLTLTVNVKVLCKHNMQCIALGECVTDDAQILPHQLFSCQFVLAAILGQIDFKRQLVVDVHPVMPMKSTQWSMRYFGNKQERIPDTQKQKHHHRTFTFQWWAI